MRDIVLTSFIFGSVPFILRWPTLGVFLWVWVSVMNPHRLTWSFAQNMKFAMVIAIATLVGILLSRDQNRLPITRVTVVLFLLALWMSVTTVFALDRASALPMWDRVMKIQFMIFVALYLLHSRQHIHILMWVCAGSVAFFAIKGGLFTLRVGGQYLVYGPPSSFIGDNNAMALAAIMTIPLLQYLQLQAQSRWLRYGLITGMILCGFAALGSQSRGALLAVSAMLMFLWVKSHRKLLTGLLLLMLVPIAIGFMPQTWMDRMQSIQNYEQDGSAMGRINSWTMAINLTKDRPLVGGGFELYGPEVFARYAPNPTGIHSAHSIYFQMLGEHGYVGLALFLLLWLFVWRDASWIIRQARSRGELKWASDLARMIQVSLVGYAVGGAFLNLAYYDVPYNLLVAIVLARLLVAKATEQARPNESVPASTSDSMVPGMGGRMLGPLQRTVK
jgi:putative inorganic carbon (hco3(-)) transporter